MMRIVALAPFGLRPKATLSRRALPMLQAAAARGDVVHVLAPSDLCLADAGSTSIIKQITVEHGPDFGQGNAAMLRSVGWMLKRCLALQPDLVHLFKPKGYGGMALPLIRRLRPKLPIFVDTDDWEGTGGWNDRLDYPRQIKMLIDWQERNLPKLADCVTVASQTLANQVILFGLPTNKLLYLPNGVDLPRRQLPERNLARAQLGLNQDPIILLYSRFWEFPVSDVVVMMVGVLAQIPTAKLLVIGAGEHGEEQQLTLLAQRAGISHALDNRGWSEQSMIDAALAAADVALYPMDDTLLNRAKCSAKLTEQMQAGLPIVAAAVGQVVEYLDQTSGVLVEPSNSGALARAVIQLLQQPQQRQSLGRAAQNRIEKLFNWPAQSQTLLQRYDACYKAQ
ncbi:glycosyltransferase [Herpetosiphon gulosus]|uniref:D-inositol-3-phosphate glycosyltransferase n=1 Tax=Herpetosiphon gulosus TaxID=1973496 RepID=A0ABP9X1C9_9CHLR